MSTRTALAELRRKKQCIEKAIRALEELQRIEEAGSRSRRPAALKPTGTSNVVELPRRRRED